MKSSNKYLYGYAKSYGAVTILNPLRSSREDWSGYQRFIVITGSFVVFTIRSKEVL